MSSTLAFFLSSGRCGTQWITDVLRQLYSDAAEIEHEPIFYNYRPKSTLRTGRFVQTAEEVDELKRHLGRVGDLVRSGRSYIETGWPAISWMPYFIGRYQPAVRLIHLTRHPVYFALSMQTHGFYGPEGGGYVQHAQLDPTSPGVLHKEYADRWSTLSRFEKCLFQWLEINAYARELHRTYPEVPFLCLHMEDLVASDAAWTQMTDFLGLPSSAAEIRNWRRERVDKHRLRTDDISDPMLIYRHPVVLELASELGYDPSSFDRGQITSRYQWPWHLRPLKRVGKVVIPRQYRPTVRRMVRRLLVN